LTPVSSRFLVTQTTGLRITGTIRADPLKPGKLSQPGFSKKIMMPDGPKK
jgi:hypothetical protein